MILRNKNILLISPEPWNHIFVSKHHYAVHLGRRGNHVYFLEPPGESESVAPTEYENVVEVKYRGFPKGLRLYPHILQRHFIRKKFSKLERLCNTRFDVIWSFDNSVFFDFSALPDGVLKISHIVDLNQDFQTGRAAATADICFCTTELIRARLSEFNSKCYKINHGFNHITSAGGAVTLPGSSPVKVVYAGNLAMQYIDWDVIHGTVRDNPDIDFIFIGPDSNGKGGEISKQQVREAKNAHFPGRVHADDLALYYKSADILILAYKEKYHADQANPHKMMEYLGSGRMVVATFTAEYSGLKDNNLLSMTQSNLEFTANLKKVLDNLAFWNSSDKQLLRKEWAMENTYDEQLGRIEGLL